MATNASVRIEGLEELAKTLDILPREAHNVARNAVQAIAGEVRNAVRKKAPKNTGILRKAITAVRNKPRKFGDVSSDVRVTSGANAKYDAFYWRFLEYGTQKLGARPFITPVVEEFRPRIPHLFREHFGIKLEAFFARKAKKAAAK